jgi:hypothetical protein
VGFAVDKVALGQVFSEYFGFPCQFSFHRLLHTHLSTGAGTIGRSIKWTQVSPHPKKLKKKLLTCFKLNAWYGKSQERAINVSSEYVSDLVASLY